MLTVGGLSTLAAASGPPGRAWWSRAESGVQVDSSVAHLVIAVRVLLTWGYGWALIVNVGQLWLTPDAPETPRRPVDAPAGHPHGRPEGLVRFTPMGDWFEVIYSEEFRRGYWCQREDSGDPYASRPRPPEGLP